MFCKDVFDEQLCQLGCVNGPSCGYKDSLFGESIHNYKDVGITF